MSTVRPLQTALYLLLQARHFATEVGRNQWDFAVEIERLKNEGMNESHFRWLVCKEYVEHADEITLLGQTGRSFRPTGQLSFTATTCFILTPAGAQYAHSLLNGEMDVVGFGETSPNGDHEKHGEGTETPPHWDAQRHELICNGMVVKRFKHRSPNQETILAAFEEEGWPVRLPDPLPPVGDTDPKRRLNDTIKGLNHHQENALVKFRGDGTGEGVIWEIVERQDDS